MSKLSQEYKEDRALVDFLRQHRPEAPVAPEALEEKVMAAVAREDGRRLSIVDASELARAVLARSSAPADDRSTIGDPQATSTEGPRDER